MGRAKSPPASHHTECVKLPHAQGVSISFLRCFFYVVSRNGSNAIISEISGRAGWPRCFVGGCINEERPSSMLSDDAPERPVMGTKVISNHAFVNSFAKN